jgi:hypothetical protein
MPIPAPSPNEDEGAYVTRCIEAQFGEDKPDDQKAAICYARYRESLAGQRSEVAKKLEGKIDGPMGR